MPFMDDNIVLVYASMKFVQVEIILVPGWTHSVMIASRVAAVLSWTSTRKSFLVEGGAVGGACGEGGEGGVSNRDACKLSVVEMSNPPLLTVECPKVPGFENSDPPTSLLKLSFCSKLPIRDPIDGSATLDIWV